MTPILECVRISKEYGFDDKRVAALSGADLSLFPQSVYRIFCPGKLTRLTLANLLSGLERADSGEITFCGQAYSKLNDDALQDLRLHKLGLVHNKFGLISSTTVLQNIKLPAQFLEDPRFSDGVIDENAARLLSCFDLQGHAGAFPTSLCALDRLRVAICSELCKMPRALIIDGALDELTAENQDILSLQLQRVARDMDCTIAILSLDTYRVTGEIPISISAPT